MQQLFNIKSFFLLLLVLGSVSFCSAQKVYAVWEDPSSIYRFVSFDGNTGAKTNLGTINNLLGYISPGTSTINTKTREYIFRGLTSTGNNYIYSIDLFTGKVNSNVTLLQNIVGLEYNYVTDTTYGLWEDSSQVYQVVWVDPKTGTYKKIGAVAGVSAYVGGSFSMDTKDSLYQFMGLDNSKYYLYAVHIKTGKVVYKNQVSSKIHAMRYNCSNDSLYGRLDSNNRYNLVSIDASSGGYSIIDSMAGISSGYVSDAFVLNEDSSSYIFIGFKGSSTRWIKVRQSNAQVIASPAFNYRRLAGLETANCAIPLPKPKASFSAIYTDSICVGDSILFSDISVGNPPKRKWTFSGGKPYTSTDSSVYVVYDTIGQFNVRLSVSNSSGTDDSLATNYIKVSPCGVIPTAIFTSNYIDSICEGDTITFTDISIGKPTSRRWTFFGAMPLISSDSIIKVVYNSSGNYDIRLSVSNSLGSHDSLSSKFISVKKCGAAPIANFTSSYVDTICVGDSVRFKDISAGNVTQRLWNFSGGKPNQSVVSEPHIAYDTVGSYTWKLTVSNSFGSDDSTSIHKIHVKACPLPPQKSIVKYGWSSSLVCENDTVFFTDSSSGNPTQYLWNFPGGSPASSTSKNVSVIYSNAGNYNVSLKVTNTVGSDDTTHLNQIKVIACENGTEHFHNQHLIKVFPNPFNNTLNIRLNSNNKASSFRIVDMKGRIVLNQQELLPGLNQIDEIDFISGIYIVQVFWEDNSVTFYKLNRE